MQKLWPLFGCERATNQLQRLVLHLHPKLSYKYSKVMSGHDNEDLIDYEDDIPNVASSTINGATTSTDDVDGKDKKNFSGIHSTGFRYF